MSASLSGSRASTRTTSCVVILGLLLAVVTSACRTASVGRSSSASEASASSGGGAPAPRDEGRLIRNLRVRAAHDLGCPEASLEIRELVAGTQGVSGCGKRTTYLLTHAVPRRWVMNSEVRESETPGAKGGASSSGGAQLTAAQNADGKRTLTLTLPRGSWGIVMKLQARPADYPDRARLVFQRATAESMMAQCEFKEELALSGSAPAKASSPTRTLAEGQESL